MLTDQLKKFWSWYERYYILNVGLAAGLFVLQLIHLYWLTTDVVFFRLLGSSFFSPSPVWELIIILVDYTEIPAILTTSLVYINEIRKGHVARGLWYLLFINSQWLHIFWITDELVLEKFTEGVRETVLPLWLAWVAIFIDYLELPVIFDTLKKFFAELLDK